MTNAEIIKRLRDFAGDLTVIDPEAHRLAITLCYEAADDLEAAGTRIANLELALARCQTNKKQAREEVLRVLDKRLAEREEGK